MDNAITNTRSKFHGPIIGLLFAVLLLSLTVVGLLVSSKEASPKPEAVAQACTTQVAAVVKAKVDELKNACPPATEAPEIITVPSSLGGVGFKYPTGWSAVINNDLVASTWRASVVPGYLFLCTDCDGPFVDVRLAANKKTDPRVIAFPTFEEFVNNQYSDKFFYPDTVVTKASSGTGTLYTVTGSMTNGMYQGTFETLYFEGVESWAEVQFMDVEAPSPASVAAWEIVKNSLDFSQIK